MSQQEEQPQPIPMRPCGVQIWDTPKRVAKVDRSLMHVIVREAASIAYRVWRAKEAQRLLTIQNLSVLPFKK